MTILYEDRRVLVIRKEPGLLSEASGGSEADVVTQARAYLTACGSRTPYAAAVHRLDRNVGGVMVLSKDAATAGRLQAALTDKAQCRKEYLAVLRGTPADGEGECRDMLFHDTVLNKTFVTDRSRRGSKEAVLSYRVLAVCGEEGISLVRIRLLTGRTHQIRVQFSSRGTPVLGDGKYGGGENRLPDGSLALWSEHLALTLPGGRPIDVTATPPAVYPWTCFAGVLGDAPKNPEENGKNA